MLQDSCDEFRRYATCFMHFHAFTKPFFCRGPKWQRTLSEYLARTFWKRVARGISDENRTHRLVLLVLSH